MSEEVSIIFLQVESYSLLGKVVGKYDIIPLRERVKLTLSPVFFSISTRKWVDVLSNCLGISETVTP